MTIITRHCEEAVADAATYPLKPSRGIRLALHSAEPGRLLRYVRVDGEGEAARAAQ